MARRGRTSNPLLVAILQAQTINRILGGPFVGPWDVDQLDDVTLDTIMALAQDLPNYRKGQAEVEKKLAEWRNGHPTYRK